ncbi:hypothetical protein AQJ58_14940 [Streptomyces sp. DSM 15324]|nr:hypothetical protein AQJ58_14940 [Streptomyces sp. DSM 15324]
MATLAVAVSPSSAAPVVEDAVVINDPQPLPDEQGGENEVAVEVTTASCGDWNRAVGVPLRWSRELNDGCGLFGRPGLKVGYSWKAERGRPCIKVKGFVNGRVKWYDAGCGASGEVRNVPWGNVLAEKGIKVKGASLFVWR